VALTRITSPPMVGVPRLTWCVVGPSSLIGWPKPCLVNHPMASRVPSREQITASPLLSRTARM
jgi:hypothetical protein